MQLVDVSAMKTKKPRAAAYYEISYAYIHGGAVGWEFVNYHAVQRAAGMVCAAGMLGPMAT
jgi:hypothetical protein